MSLFSSDFVARMMVLCDPFVLLIILVGEYVCVWVLIHYQWLLCIYDLEASTTQTFLLRGTEVGKNLALCLLMLASWEVTEALEIR